MSAENMVFAVFCLVFVIPTLYVLMPRKKSNSSQPQNRDQDEFQEDPKNFKL